MSDRLPKVDILKFPIQLLDPVINEVICLHARSHETIL